MTIGSTGFSQIQQIPGEVLSRNDLPGASSVSPAGAQSFASTLAQVTSELLAIDSLSGVGGNSGHKNVFQQAATDLTSTTDGSQGELSMIALLLSAKNGSATSATSNLQGLSGPGIISGQDVVAKAAQFLGTPYVWGGSTPSGFDCSGLTQYVYAQLGVSLPRTSEQQATMGTPVKSLADAQPGDLVFFAGSDGTDASPGHVGIYIGNGEMIDAPYSGTTVQVHSVSSAGPIVAIRQVLSNSSYSGETMIGNVRVPAQYVSTIEGASANSGIPPSLLAALLSQESGFNPGAISPAGASGIAQFMPSTAAGLGINPADPTAAIGAAAKLLASYANRFGSYAYALAAYNAGASAVEKYGGIPPYPETQAYVSRVLSRAGLLDRRGMVT